MALEQQPADYDQMRESLVTYCNENNVISPYDEYPFAWPDCISRSVSPFLDITDCFPFARPISPERFVRREQDLIDPNSLATCVTHEDLVSICETKAFRLETPLLHHNAGLDYLRKYGPDSLRKCAANVPKLCLEGDDGMELPQDDTDVIKAFERDGQISATQEQVDYFKNIMGQIMRKDSDDVILPRVVSVSCVD